MGNKTAKTRPTAKKKSENDINKFAATIWEWFLVRDPITATFYGDRRFDDKLPDNSDKAVVEEYSQAKRYVETLDKTKWNFKNQEERNTADVIRRKLNDIVDGFRFKFHEMQIDQLQGPQIWFFELSNFHTLRNDKDGKNLAKRFVEFKKYIKDYIDNHRNGLKDGRRSPRVARERVRQQLNVLSMGSFEQSPFAAAVKNAADTKKISGSTVDSIAKAYSNVKQGLVDLFHFVDEEYKTREHDGVWDTPNGDEAYEFLAKLHTLTDLSPKKIHEIGLEEMDKIHREMESIGKKFGAFKNYLEFINFVNNDKKNYFTTREELLTTFEGCMKRANSVLPKFFGTLPKAKCIVKSIEEYREKDAPAAYYYPPSDDFSRPGTFYANTFEPASRQRYNSMALTVHEGVPGHHFQIARAMELKGLPMVRTHSHFTAYVEGWGLYTERLADEMGLYNDPLSTFGMLTYQAWRAARLVVDTGIHALKWNRERTVQYFKDNFGLSDIETLNEIDRYIVWPGQALAYTIGMREIFKLRQEAKSKLKSKFDIRKFHDDLLDSGALPFSTLRSKILG